MIELCSAELLPFLGSVRPRREAPGTGVRSAESGKATTTSMEDQVKPRPDSPVQVVQLPGSQRSDVGPAENNIRFCPKITLKVGLPVGK